MDIDIEYEVRLHKCMYKLSSESHDANIFVLQNDLEIIMRQFDR